MNSLESKLRKHFESLIKGFFKFIGPESKISNKGLSVFEFEDNLYFNEYYFSGGTILKEFFLDDISKYHSGVNILTSYELFKYICKIIYNKIKSRVEVIDDTLNVYLKEDDIDYGFSEIFKKLDESNRIYKVYLLSNLVSLINVNSVEIGKVKLINLNEETIKVLPQNIEKCFSSAASEALAESKYLSPEQFLQEFKGRVILETSVEGYHLNNEISKVFEDALREYKRVFSYLSICKIFLENVKADKYNIETEALKIFDYGIHNEAPQYFYIYDKNQTKFLKIIDTKFEKVELPKILFKINKDSLEKIKKRCCLDNFNEILQNQKKYGKIGDKITRSIDWFYRGIIEEDNTNKAIALFISLEILMSARQDNFSSLSDDLAENIAIITKLGVEERYKAKKDFKNNIYQLRNDIMHRGEKIRKPKDFRNLETLRISLIWSIRWVIENIEILKKDGKHETEALKEYFEKQKLK
jgi:hypothetical protein